MNTDENVRRMIFTRFHDRLNEFRLNKELCDVTIQIKDKTFCCHRIVLASACRYFATMFTAGPFEEGKNGNVKLNGIIKPKIFEEMLSFMYTGNININGENSCDLLIASEYLGLYFIEELCTAYITENIMSIKDVFVFEMLRFALVTEKKRLFGVLVTYISDNFPHLCQSDVFFVISCEMLKLILQAIRYMEFENTDVIMNSIIEWVRYNPVERKLFVPELLQMLDSTKNISINNVNILIAIISRPTIDTNSKIKNEIFDIGSNRLNNACEIDVPNERILKNISPLNADVYCKKYSGSYCMNTVALDKKCHWKYVRSLNIRKFLPCKRVAAGNKLYYFYCSSTTKNKLLVNYSLAKNMMLEPIHLESPPVAHPEFNVCMVANTIYLYYLETPEKYQAGVYTLDKRRQILSYSCNLNEWYLVPKPVYTAENASLVSCADNVYLLGGENTAKNGRLVQRYDPRTPVWQNLSPMIHEHINASACEHDGKIYISGGDSQLAEVFDPVAGKWEEIAPMRTTRSYHKLVSYNNLVWAIGNETDLSCEVYDPKICMWTHIPAMDDAVNAIDKPIKKSMFADAYVFEFVG